jgi:hypothetical protein
MWKTKFYTHEKTNLYKLDHITIIAILWTFDSEPYGSKHYAKLNYI